MSTKLDYTHREFRTILEELKQNLRVDLPDVNDFLESNAGRYLLDQWAAIGDMIGFSIDRSAAECYIDTVETRPNLISLLKLIGFQPMNPVPEQVLVTLSSPTPVPSDTVIPKYTKLQALSGKNVIPFVTAYSATIPTGETLTTAIAVQGEWKSIQFTSNGSRFQGFLVNSKNVADGYIRIFVNSYEWNRAIDNTFVGHSASSLVFKIINTSDRRTIIEFGNGVEGAIPPVGQIVRIEYMDTLHTSGRIKTGEMRFIDNELSTLAVYNSSPSSGGRDFETIDSARLRYPVAFKSLKRAVTLEDWEAIARLVPGVMQAKAVDINSDPSLPYFKVRLYVIGDGGLVSDALNNQVRDEIRKRRTNAAVFDILSPTPIITNVKGTIYVLRNYNQDEVLSDVIFEISNFFTMTGDSDSEVKVGESVSYSHLIARLQSVLGVSRLLLTEPETDIQSGLNEFVSLDTIDIKVAGVI